MGIEKIAVICIMVVAIVFLMGVFPTLAVGLTMLATVALFLLDRNS